MAEEVVNYLLQVLSSSRHKVETLPDKLRAIKNFEQLSALAWGIRKMSLALGKGDLDYSSEERGIVIGGLKSLQSNLKHLTWQAKQIAKGDYSHRVDFMGEFSEAFNLMTRQLASHITTLVKTSKEYKDKSFQDPLTGIYNRMAFMHYAEEILREIEAGASSILIIADIDKFKSVNDRYGHPCGDTVLKAFAACLVDCIRPSDLCCRYGGEEFLMLLPRASLASGLVVAERVRSMVERMVVSFENTNILLTASFGVSEIGGKASGASFADFIAVGISRADANLYKAKELGRNQVVG